MIPGYLEKKGEYCERVPEVILVLLLTHPEMAGKFVIAKSRTVDLNYWDTNLYSRHFLITPLR